MPLFDGQGGPITRWITALLPLLGVFLYDWAEGEFGLLPALAIGLGCIGAEILWVWVAERRLSKIGLWTGLLVGVLGGLAWLSGDERFVRYSPAIGDVLFASAVLLSTRNGGSLLVSALEEQRPDLDLEERERHFFVGLTRRFGLLLLVHGAWIIWTVQFDPDNWTWVSGMGSYLLIGGQFVGEALYLRLVLHARWDAEDAQAKAAGGPSDP